MKIETKRKIMYWIPFVLLGIIIAILVPKWRLALLIAFPLGWVGAYLWGKWFDYVYKLK